MSLLCLVAPWSAGVWSLGAQVVEFESHCLHVWSLGCSSWTFSLGSLFLQPTSVRAPTGSLSPGGPPSCPKLQDHLPLPSKFKLVFQNSALLVFKEKTFVTIPTQPTFKMAQSWESREICNTPGKIEHFTSSLGGFWEKTYQELEMACALL
jgi:hypothetical protein